ncbi:MAG TPA: glutaredoxin family protein [Bryobacteraceae bacterium]|nr:glutaredoxin family protein [Bryobacteraceae bacterium]
MERPKVYGADWCPMTRRSRSELERLGVEYDYIEVETDSAASAWVKSQNGGKEKKPTIQVGALILTEPTNRELEDALRQERVLV